MRSNHLLIKVVFGRDFPQKLTVKTILIYFVKKAFKQSPNYRTIQVSVQFDEFYRYLPILPDTTYQYY